MTPAPKSAMTDAAKMCRVDVDATLAEVAAALAATGALAAAVVESDRAIGLVTARALLAHWPHGHGGHRGPPEPPSGRSFGDEPE